MSFDPITICYGGFVDWPRAVVVLVWSVPTMLLALRACAVDGTPRARRLTIRLLLASVASMAVSVRWFEDPPDVAVIGLLLAGLGAAASILGVSLYRRFGPGT